MRLTEKIIVALDVNNLTDAKNLVQMLLPYVRCFKIGLELMSSVGTPQAVECIHSLGGEVFLDGKFNDIPNTVAKACKATSQLGVKIFNVHASAGVDALKAAVQNKGNSILLAVTVLTSIDDAASENIFGANTQDKVLQFALDAKKAGIDGIVCSAQDLKLFSKHEELSSLLKITPGVRPHWSQTNDQRRVLTPKEALELGADALVIGRPITDPPLQVGTPIDAIKKVLGEICQKI